MGFKWVPLKKVLEETAISSQAQSCSLQDVCRNFLDGGLIISGCKISNNLHKTINIVGFASVDLSLSCRPEVEIEEGSNLGCEPARLYPYLC